MSEDKSTVLGIRLDAEERKRFDYFVSEEGKNNKSFLDTLLNLYELNKGKVKNINLVGDIETLEGYTNKIHQALRGLCSNGTENYYRDPLMRTFTGILPP